MSLISHALKHVCAHQLVQDKICLYNYPNTTETYCVNLNIANENNTLPGHFKSKILGDVATFGLYHTLIATLPALFWSLFVGAWIDRYVKARKILMIFSVGSQIIENLIAICLTVKFDANPYLNLLLHIPSSVFGGHITSRIAIIHYMTSTTPSKLMSMRLAFVEMCLFVANPIGTLLGGVLLVQTPMFKSYGFKEIRNYTFIYLIALGFELVALLWIVVMVNEKIAREQEMKIEMKIQGIDSKTNDKDIKLKSDMTKEDEGKHPIKLLFDFENIRTMVRTVFKERPHKKRAQLFMLLGSLLIMVMAFHGRLNSLLSLFTMIISAYLGGGHIAGLFIQKIYMWAPNTHAFMHALSMVIHAVATLTLVPLLIKGIGVSDIHLGIIGYLTYFIRADLMGTWLDTKAFYISMGVTSIGGVAFIGTRSYLTKIVEKDEIGKIMSFEAALDTLAPLLASTIFTFIFRSTIDTYPGLVYQLIAFLTLFPICMMMWIDIHSVQTKTIEKLKKSRVPSDETKNEKDKSDTESCGNTDENEEGENEERNSNIKAEYLTKRNSVIDTLDNIKMNPTNNLKL